MLIPAEMTHNPSTPHVIDIDKFDWMNKTLEGGSFHATTAIIIEQQDTEHQTSTVSVPNTATRRRTLDDDVRMRSTCSKVTLIKAILEQTKIHTLEKLSQSIVKTAVVIDAMHFIRKLSFSPNENFFMCLTDIIHFCCDRYQDVSL